VLDGALGDYEMAVVVSNDSDLAYPIHVVRRVLKLRVAVLAPIFNPDPRNLPKNVRPRTPSVELRTTANYFWLADPADMQACQLPLGLSDADGPIVKPPSW
jgi:hypothetical protein